jgi:hypothetical protein
MFRLTVLHRDVIIETARTVNTVWSLLLCATQRGGHLCLKIDIIQGRVLWWLHMSSAASVTEIRKLLSIMGYRQGVKHYLHASIRLNNAIHELRDNFTATFSIRTLFKLCMSAECRG